MTLQKALGREVAKANRDFLNDPEAMREAEALGKLYARVCAALDKGFVQKPYPEETLEEFCQRAGT